MTKDNILNWIFIFLTALSLIFILSMKGILLGFNLAFVNIIYIIAIERFVGVKIKLKLLGFLPLILVVAIVIKETLL